MSSSSRFSILLFVRQLQNCGTALEQQLLAPSGRRAAYGARMHEWFAIAKRGQLAVCALLVAARRLNEHSRLGASRQPTIRDHIHVRYPIDGVIITAQPATLQGVVVLGEPLAGIHFAKVLVELTRLGA